MRIELAEPAAPKPAIWAFGGGKGGVGKSVIAANVGVALARTGHRVVLVDADLGGANLHTLLGMANPRRTLSDFIARRVGSLDDVMTATPTSGLWLISGARALLEMANPKHAQKQRLLRHIRGLDVDHVLIDLGAGSAFNVLDFFLLARQGILVVVPEHTSVENAYHFLKAAFYRKLKRAQPRDRVRAAIRRVMDEKELRGVQSPKDLITQVSQIDGDAGRALTMEASSFAPAVVVNRVERPEHRRLGEDMAIVCREYFGTNVETLGYLENDALLAHSVRVGEPAVEKFPESRFSLSIRELADRLAGAGPPTHGD